MTRVLVLGATGRAGSAVLTELPTSSNVVAALRSPSDTDRLPAAASARVETTVVDITDPGSLRQAAGDVDVIVNAIRLRGDIPPAALVDLHDRLVSATAAHTWIVTVGGAGALRLLGGKRFSEHPAFPGKTLPRGIAHARLRDHLESGQTGTRWTYLIPPPAFDPDGLRTGRFHAGAPSSDETAFTRKSISYDDFAVATARAALEQWEGTFLIGL